jgi:two-component system NtrC family sensor kinase
MKWPICSRWKRRHVIGPHALPVASILVPLLLFGIVATLDRIAVFGNAERDVVNTTDIFEEHALSLFQAHELMAIAIDGWLGKMSWDQIGSSPLVNQYLKQFADRYPQVLGLWLLDPNGKLRNSSRDPSVAEIDLSDRDYFGALREKDVGTFISGVVTGRVAAEKNFNIARRRSSAEKEFDGIIVVSVSPDYFTNFWRQTASPATTFTGLLRNDLTILAREPSSPSLNLSPTSAAAVAIRQNDRGSFRAISPVDGIDRLAAFRRVGSSNVYVVHGVAVNAVLGLWYQHLAIYGAFFALAATGLFWSSRRAFAEIERRLLAEDQLRQAEKMEVLGQLTGQFAHDFSNILTAVLLNLEALRGGATHGAKRNDAVNHAFAAAEQGQKVVRSMLALARREPIKSEFLQVDGILAAIEMMVRQALGPNLQLVVVAPPETWPVWADPVQLELAVLNLALNARDAMPHGGMLRVTASNVSLRGEPNGLEGDFVALAASDTGTGIPQHVISRVFDPFFTTKEKGKGTGLGLSQVHSFATGCGGTAIVESGQGRGTTVTLFLPRTTEAPPPAKAHLAAAAAGVEPDERSRITILVVEDQERVREIVVQVLREHGYVAIEARTGDEALAILSGHPEIALIFTDVRMPKGHDGIAVVAEARRLYPDIKVVFATGDPDRLRHFKGGTILRKPYRARQILDAVDKEFARNKRDEAVESDMGRKQAAAV